MEKSQDQENPDAIAQTGGDHKVGETLKFQHDVHDQGAGLFQEVQEYSREELETESAEVRSLIDWNIMPIVSNLPYVFLPISNQEQICITYMIQFLDKLSLNYASAYTLKDDLGLTG